MKILIYKNAYANNNFEASIQIYDWSSGIRKISILALFATFSWARLKEFISVIKNLTHINLIVYMWTDPIDKRLWILQSQPLLLFEKVIWEIIRRQSLEVRSTSLGICCEVLFLDLTTSSLSLLLMYVMPNDAKWQTRLLLCVHVFLDIMVWIPSAALCQNKSFLH